MGCACMAVLSWLSTPLWSFPGLAIACSPAALRGRGSICVAIQLSHPPPWLCRAHACELPVCVLSVLLIWFVCRCLAMCARCNGVLPEAAPSYENRSAPSPGFVAPPPPPSVAPFCCRHVSLARGSWPRNNSRTNLPHGKRRVQEKNLSQKLQTRKHNDRNTLKQVQGQVGGRWSEEAAFFSPPS